MIITSQRRCVHLSLGKARVREHSTTRWMELPIQTGEKSSRAPHPCPFSSWPHPAIIIDFMLTSAIPMTLLQIHFDLDGSLTGHANGSVVAHHKFNTWSPSCMQGIATTYSGGTVRQSHRVLVESHQRCPILGLVASNTPQTPFC